MPLYQVEKDLIASFAIEAKDAEEARRIAISHLDRKIVGVYSIDEPHKGPHGRVLFGSHSIMPGSSELIICADNPDDDEYPDPVDKQENQGAKQNA